MDEGSESADKGRQEGGIMHVCMACGYTWKGRKEDGLPVNCPNCRSSLWNAEKIHRHLCSKCGHRWMSRKEHPVRCPSCRTKAWDQWVSTYQCSDCGYREDSLVSKAPLRCPECGSERWGRDFVRCICKRCGYVGMYKPGVPGRCPVCKATVSPMKESDAVRQTRPDAPDITDGIVAILSECSADTRESCMKLLMGSGLSPEDAEILSRYASGDQEIDIARMMDLSYGKVAGIVGQYRARSRP